MAISGTGVAVASAGAIFLWSALKGESPSEVFRSLVTGKQPTGANDHPINQQQFTASGAATGALVGAGGSASAAAILTVAASMKGQPYGFGAGHTDNPCASPKTDCSSYVSCVLNKVGIMKGSMTTGGFAKFGVGVPYAQRMPGDLIIWNGGTGGGHMGIILDANRFWNNPCTACGGVAIGHYPYGSRTAASAIIRRVAK